MSIVPVAPVTNVPSVPYPFVPPPFTDVAPLSYRDGTTYLEYLRGLNNWIQTILIPYINDNLTSLGQNYLDVANNLIISVNDALNTFTDTVNNDLSTQATNVNNALSAQSATVTQQLADNLTAINKAVSDVENSAITVQDPVIEGILNNPASQSREALNGIFEQQTSLDVDMATHVTGPSSSRTALDNLYAKLSSPAGSGITINVRALGAKGDGVTDDSAAFNAAIAQANALGNSDRENNTGITILIPDGKYLIPASLNPIIVSAVTVTGASRNGTSLLLSVSGPTFTFGDSTRVKLPLGFTFKNLKIEYLTDPTPSAVVINIDYGFEVVIEDVQIVRIGTLVSCGTSAQNIASGVTIRNVKGSSANVGQPFINLKYGGGIMVSDTATFVRGVVPPTDPNTMTTMVNTNVINAINSNWDTVQIVNCIFERYDYGLAVTSGAGSVFQDVFISNTIMDYFKTTDLYFESDAGGVINTIKVVNSWFSCWENNAITIVGAGMNEFIDISAIIPIAGLSALNYNNNTAKHNKFRLDVVSTDRIGTALAAIVFAAGSTGFNLIDSRGNENNGAGTWQNDWAVYVGADCDDYIISNNHFSGKAGGAFNLPVNTTPSKNRIITGNINDNYSGNATFVVPATGTPWVNLSGHVVELNIYGGTVTEIDKNAINIVGMTSGNIRLSPGESITFTYSTVPNVTMFIIS